MDALKLLKKYKIKLNETECHELNYYEKMLLDAFKKTVSTGATENKDKGEDAT